MPWAIRSGNLTYLGEIPFSYVGHGDRYLAAADGQLLVGGGLGDRQIGLVGYRRRRRCRCGQFPSSPRCCRQD